MTIQRFRCIGVALSIAALAGLAGCGKRGEDQTVGQKLDSAIDRTAQAGREVRQEGREVAQEARTAVMGAASGAKSAASDAGAHADDGQITAKVKNGLSADKDLSALRIDVDTKDGIVTLTGNAPTEAARQRATDIARHVADVKEVRNQLVVKAG